MAKRKQYIEAAGPRVPQLSVSLQREIFVRAMMFSTYWFAISERGTRGHLDKDSWLYDSELMFKHVREGMALPINFIETGKHIGYLSNVRIVWGEQFMCSDPDGLAVYARFLGDDWDSQDADTWLQFVVLGKVKFA